MDDALITLRYSENLAQKGQPIWNDADADHPTMGFTSPAWMVLNAAQVLFTSNKDAIIAVSKFWSLLMLLLFAWGITSQIEQQHIAFPNKILYTILLLWNPVFAFHACSGMDSIFFSAALVLFAVMATRCADYKFMIFLGISLFIIRPEGILAAALYWIYDLVLNKNYRKSLLGLLFAAFLVICYHVIVYQYYGHLFPSAFYIKQAGESFVKYEAVKMTVLFLFFAASPLILFLISIKNKIKNAATTFILLLAGFYLFYYLTVFPLMNAVYRYQLPILALLILAAATHLSSFQKQRRIVRYPVIMMFLIVFIFNFGLTGKYATKVGQANNNLKALGLFMKQFNDYQDWLMYHDAGFVCYYSDFNTIDTHGLNTIDLAVGEKTEDDYLKDKKVKYYLHNGRTKDLNLIQTEDRVLAHDFSYVGSVPASYDGIEYFVVKIYQRGGAIQPSDLMHIAVDTEVRSTWFDQLYYAGRKIIKGR